MVFVLVKLFLIFGGASYLGPWDGDNVLFYFFLFLLPTFLFIFPSGP